jgi:hypothetical protein
MTPLFLTVRLSPAAILKALPRVGLVHPRVLVAHGKGVFSVQCRGPASFGGCVRSLAFVTGRPVLLQVGASRVAHLVMPKRGDLGDMAELEVAP